MWSIFISSDAFQEQPRGRQKIANRKLSFSFQSPTKTFSLCSFNNEEFYVYIGDTRKKFQKVKQAAKSRRFTILKPSVWIHCKRREHYCETNTKHFLTWIEICASLNHRKKTKADGSRLIPRKHTETLMLLSNTKHIRDFEGCFAEKDSLNLSCFTFQAWSIYPPKDPLKKCCIQTSKRIKITANCSANAVCWTVVVRFFTRASERSFQVGALREGRAFAEVRQALVKIFIKRDIQRLKIENRFVCELPC